ncbi:MAG TPA: ATP-binding protein [Acidobacteriota bacterium]|nr:ATP-binding protein [Acidobacteriota bacterium]
MLTTDHQDSAQDGAAPRKATPFTRHLKGIFFFLVAVVVIGNISPLLVLDRQIRREERAITARIRQAANELQRQWARSARGELGKLDLATIADKHALRHLWIGTFREGADRGAWQGRSVTFTNRRVIETDTLLVLPPPTQSDLFVVEGAWYRTRTLAMSWSGQPVTVGATVDAPLLGMLHVQMQTERWLRSLVLLGFLTFSVLFYRLVLLPFHDMRRRATALAQTGILPPAPGSRDNDPEYVMASFDRLVAHFSEEADKQKERAADSARQARDLEKFNAYILSSLSTGVIILDRAGRILRLNRSAESILHLSAAHITGAHFMIAELPPPLEEVLRQGLEEDRVYKRRELDAVCGDPAETIHLGINTSQIRNDDDDTVGLSLLLTDLTKIKRLESEVAENQRLADLGELAAGLAHQLRNSIAAIFGYGKMLRRSVASDDPHSQWVDAIVSETDETSDMITRFLDFARPLHGDRHPVDLPGVVTDAVASARTALADREVVFSPPAADGPPLPPVLGDELLLKQVFLNLIHNAAEATDSGGTINVTIVRRESVEGVPSQVIVAVTDDGPGIREEDRVRIFHPFFTTKETGTGLGLALARKIMIFHHGSLVLAATGPSGSTFAVTLPLAPAETPDGIASDRSKPQNARLPFVE